MTSNLAVFLTTYKLAYHANGKHPRVRLEDVDAEILDYLGNRVFALHIEAARRGDKRSSNRTRSAHQEMFSRMDADNISFFASIDARPVGIFEVPDGWVVHVHVPEDAPPPNELRAGIDFEVMSDEELKNYARDTLSTRLVSASRADILAVIVRIWQ